MEIALAVLVGALFACGLHLVLQSNLLRMVFGLSILNTAVNLLIITVGRVTRGRPALIEEGASVPVEPMSNPLPQALALTAVVIGFGLLAFTLVLVLRSYPALGTLDTDLHTRELDDRDHDEPANGDAAEDESETGPGTPSALARREVHGHEPAR